MLFNYLKMIQIDRNMSELRQIMCTNAVLTLVHLLIILCELLVNARKLTALRLLTGLKRLPDPSLLTYLLNYLLTDLFSCLLTYFLTYLLT